MKIIVMGEFELGNLKVIIKEMNEYPNARRL